VRRRAFHIKGLWGGNQRGEDFLSEYRLNGLNEKKKEGNRRTQEEGKWGRWGEEGKRTQIVQALFKGKEGKGSAEQTQQVGGDEKDARGKKITLTNRKRGKKRIF